ncbi:MAG: preprotein translocase subunit SecA [Candidatus Firestonebacteria bacterium]
MLKYLKKIFGTKNDREIKRISLIVLKVNEYEQGIKKLTDDELKLKTPEFKFRLEKGETFEDILPEAFAVVREASVRTIGQRHYDTQLIGGIVLHEGKIAEMRTGEGKTLVAALPVYLNALSGKGVHLVTTNDYLAERDSFGKGNFKGMGNIYSFLGLTYGCIKNDSSNDERRAAYGADITYGTNNEFGFDYLRDNMATALEDLVQQRPKNFAIVDEVDSILIDEARTPLIISGPAEESTDKYYKANRIVPEFSKDSDYKIDEKSRTVVLTEAGVAKAEKLLDVENMYEGINMDWAHYVNNALKAHVLFKREDHYIIKDNEVLIVDEFTGRLMPGRRWSDGLHQAVEAKEGVKIRRENQTLATITLQNYFKMYKKLAGMTGTADTEAEEFMNTYKLDVVVIPTNKPMIRKDYPDEIYKTRIEKLEAVANEIAELNKQGRPVLVGTISIEKNEEISSLLNKRGVKHQLLNAKFHEKEAEITAVAGAYGGVTVATNMAGRGTDIVLGDKVADLGGLHVIGTERHEARRIDNQLRGRCGRQGDKGSTKFYLSLEDDLMRIFGGDKIFNLMDRLGMEEGQPIVHPWITKAIEGAQKRVEGFNYEARKHLLEYDNVMNKQREVVYGQRRKILEGDDMKENIVKWQEDIVDGFMDAFAAEKLSSYEWDLESLSLKMSDIFGIDYKVEKSVLSGMRREALRADIIEKISAVYEEKEKKYDKMFKFVERMIMLQTIDGKWKDHLYAMDQLREGIGLRAYGGKDPLLEYKKEGFEMFTDMIERIKDDTLRMVYRVQLRHGEDIERQELEEAAKAGKAVAGKINYSHREVNQFGAAEEAARQRQIQRKAEQGGMDPMGARLGDRPVMNQAPRTTPIKRDTPKVGRNDPCPCGSGKKYKKCCGINKD